MRPHVILGGGVLLASAFVISLLAPDAASPPEVVVDRVGFAPDYRTAFQALRSSFKAQTDKVATTYANAVAGSVEELEQLPYPRGSIFVFEWTVPVKGARGAPGA